MIGCIVLVLIAGLIASKIVNKRGEGFFLDIGEGLDNLTVAEAGVADRLDVEISVQLDFRVVAIDQVTHVAAGSATAPLS